MSNSPKNQAEEMAENIAAQVRAVASAMNGGYMRGVNITIFRPCFSCSEPDFSFDAERLYYDQNNQNWRQRAQCSKQSICKHVDGLSPIDLNEGTLDAMHNLNRCVSELNYVLGTEVDDAQGEPDGDS